MTKPNVLILFTDDQRYDTIHALGNENIRTPNMDRLVGQGTTFTQAHIPCGTHGAICMPSRAMLHTGRTLFHLKNSGETIPEEHTMLGEAFRENGYRTWGCGKWHNGRSSFNRGFDDGDEVMFGGMADHWNVPAYHYDSTGRYDAELAYIPDPPSFGNNEVKYRQADHIHAGRHSSELLADAAVDFIRTQDVNNPFLAYVAFLAPHDPRTMPENFRAMYPPESIELPPNYSGGHPFNNGALKIRDELLAEFPRSPEETKRHIAEYYAMITHLDNEVGRIIDALEESGLRENTIIVLAGDNGLAVGQHGLMGKQNCYEHSIRVPLIFSGPGIPAGETRDTYVYLLDIFRTLCDLVDIDVPDSVEGENLAPAIRSHDVKVRTSLYFAFYAYQRAIKNERYKLIEYAPRDAERRTQLFVLEADPWETNDLYGRSEFLSISAQLREDMLDFRDDWEQGNTERSAGFWQRY